MYKLNDFQIDTLSEHLIITLYRNENYIVGTKFSKK